MKQNKERPFSVVVGIKSPHNPRGGNDALGLAEDTVVVYASDDGFYPGEQSATRH